MAAGGSAATRRLAGVPAARRTDGARQAVVDQSDERPLPVRQPARPEGGRLRAAGTGRAAGRRSCPGAGHQRAVRPRDERHRQPPAPARRLERENRYRMNARLPFDPPSAELIAADVERAFAEDLGKGDATAELLPDEAVIAGAPWFDACFRRMDPAVRIEWQARDGERVAPGTVICRLSGHARSLVSAERSALNFLQLLSGTATVTAAYVAAVAGTGTRVLDTRKTIPGLRLAQKYAVRCGGGHNHRIGLYDAILVKENHIIAAGGIA